MANPSERLRAMVEAAKEAPGCHCKYPNRIEGHSDAGLGHDECGCYGDSGIYTVECRAHSILPALAPDLALWAAEAAEALDRWVKFQLRHGGPMIVRGDSEALLARLADITQEPADG